VAAGRLHLAAGAGAAGSSALVVGFRLSVHGSSLRLSAVRAGGDGIGGRD
jgi:hypothetical protein